jgi:hypothetical protein
MDIQVGKVVAKTLGRHQTRSGSGPRPHTLSPLPVMDALPLSPMVIGALVVGFVVVMPFCVLMWRAGYNVAWASLPFAALLLLNMPVTARPTSLVVAAAIYLLGLYAFVLTTGKGARERRLAARRAKAQRQNWQPLAAYAAPATRPAVANRAITTDAPMIMLPNGTLRPAPWAPRARTF